MNPAPSVILFTTMSGLGFGFMAFLSAGLVGVSGLHAFFLWVAGYALAVGGLLFSTFHLGNPQRALKAFSQWRSSWLSREGWAAVLTLFALAPMALSQWLGFDWPRLWGIAAALLCGVTIFTTSMIYAQLKTIPRWNHWITPVMFLTYSLTGGAIFASQRPVIMISLGALAVVQAMAWSMGDKRFAALGASMGSATGLGALGEIRVFEQPHTSPNYLMREMIYVVARKHAEKLRVIALMLAVLVPLMLLTFGPRGPASLMAALVVHFIGALSSRWLFFAEAEHVVGLYYGKR